MMSDQLCQITQKFCTIFWCWEFEYSHRLCSLSCVDPTKWEGCRHLRCLRWTQRLRWVKKLNSADVADSLWLLFGSNWPSLVDMVQLISRILSWNPFALRRQLFYRCRSYCPWWWRGGQSLYYYSWNKHIHLFTWDWQQTWADSFAWVWMHLLGAPSAACSCRSHSGSS